MRAKVLASGLVLGIIVGALPAAAEMDFSGEWAPRFYEDQPERVPGPELGDYLGLPINDAARMRADTWSASIMTLPEWQCRPHSARLHLARAVQPAHLERSGPGDARDHRRCTPSGCARSTVRSIWTAVRIRRSMPRTPGRGFSTGKWDGDVLTTTSRI